MNQRSERTLLELKELVVGYRGRGMLPPISLDIGREELWALVGRNGSGKSTLLRTLLGLQPDCGGHARWKPGTRVGYVPQRSELDLSTPMRVFDVVAQGADAGWSFLSPLLVRQRADKVLAVLEETNMARWVRQPFHALSDGQRQRVLVSRALVNDPDVLMLDEPTNGMDVSAERAAFDLFEHLMKSRHLAVVVVSHHMDLLAAAASHIAWVDREAGVVRTGDIHAVSHDPAFIEHYGTVFAREAASALEQARLGGAA